MEGRQIPWTSPRSKTKLQPEFDWGVINWRTGGKRKYEELRAGVHEQFGSVCKTLKHAYDKVVEFFRSGPDKDESSW